MIVFGCNQKMLPHLYYRPNAVNVSVLQEKDCNIIRELKQW